MFEDESQLDQIATSDLIQFVNGADEDACATGLYALGFRSTAEAVSTLVTALAHPNSFLARTASDSLIRLNRFATPALIQALTQPNNQTRALAARALAHIKDQTSIPALFNALNDDSALVQHWADEALEKMGVGQIYFKP